jgi:hypothetical protein
MLAKQYCVTLPEAVRVLPRDRIDHTIQLEVPQNLSTLPNRVFNVTKGGTFRIILRSPHPGAVGIHGLSDIVVIRPGQEVRVTFRAAFSGRFPLHFHSVDGVHLGLGDFVVS